MEISDVVVKLLLLLRFVSGFNIDVEKAIVYTGTQGSYYGATTELVSNAQGKWILVGASRQNYSGIDISKPGAIYRCPIVVTSTTGSSCTMLNIRAATSAFPTIQSEENQGLGLNMLLTNQNLVACSPMWKNAVTRDVYQAYGKCSEIAVSGLNTNVNKFFNVPNNLLVRNGKIHYVTAEFGFSSSQRAGFTNGIVLGTPVVYGSTGGFVFYQETITSNFWERFNIAENGATDNLVSVFRSGAYLGYAIGAGSFGTPAGSSHPLVVLGAPGFANTDGTIGAMGIFQRVDASNLRMRKLVTGKTVGSGYGQSVAVADFNGDNKDDIAVGAPMEGENNMNTVDVGAVYVHYGTGESQYIGNEQRLRGSGSMLARFGHSVASPGDLNKDGYNDLVVGAPYEEDNKGAIYVFNGGAPQMASSFSQRILASGLNPNLRGFGYSLSKSTIDVDDNTYLDISVGSYLSSNAVVLRTRSIANVTVTPTLNSSLLPLNSSELACSDSTTFNPCTTVEICFSYTGDGLNNGIYLEYTLTSDSSVSDVSDRRFKFYQNNVDRGTVYTRTELLVGRGARVCELYHARVSTIDRKFFLRINDRPQFDVTYKISNKSLSGQVRPVLDGNQATNMASVTGQFQTQCGPGCKPNLQVTGKSLTPAINVGLTRELEVEILVINVGDPAYGASVLVSNDFNAPLTTYAVLLAQGSERITCVAEGNNTRCTFDRSPLFPQQRGLFRMRFDVSVDRLIGGKGLRNLVPKIRVTANAIVSGDSDPADNVAQIDTYLQLQATIQMIGSSSPDQLRLSSAKTSKLTLNQAYSIINNGPSPLPEVKIVFRVPVMANDKLITPASELSVRGISPSDVCNMTYFPSPGAVTSPSIVRPTVIITQDNLQPLGCGEADVVCAVYECTIGELNLDDLHAFVIVGNLTEENIPDIKPGINQIMYYTTGIVYPSETLAVPLNLATNVSYSATLPIFPQDIVPVAQELNLWPMIVGVAVGVLLMILLGIILWKLGFFKRKKREELDEYKRKSYAHQRQSRAMLRATRDLNAADRQILSQYADLN